MIGDPTFDLDKDVLYIPEEVLARMPKISEVKMPTLADAIKHNKGEMSDAEMAELRQGMLKAGADAARDVQCVNAYKAAMLQLGVDPSNPAALLRFSKDPEKIREVNDVFLKNISR